MAYDVQVTLPERPLGRADVLFNVKNDGAVLGKLEVSQGAIEWVRRWVKSETDTNSAWPTSIN